ncbi:tRNA lysidine(34) synthetase TilS [Chloroflexota bacterium]
MTADTEKDFEEMTGRVLRFIQEQHLILEGQKLLVAVSGGADSVCLLHILVTLQKELDISLHVAHLDHQLRDAESETDARYVADLAHSMGIPATVERRDVKAYKARRHVSLEEAAREVRYSFLAQVAESVGVDRVVVGHTADDHVETILMHLIRGSGTRGLRGLQPLRRWQYSGGSLTIIRPLLAASREETVDYCHHHRLSPRIDASNLSLLPLRNKIRQQLLPLLRSYNPRVAEALLRTARIAGDELTFLDGEAVRLWGEITEKQENTVILDKGKFLELPPALKRQLLRDAIEKLLGNLKDIEAGHIEKIMDALTKSAGKRIGLPEGLTFSIEYDKYLLGTDPAALSPFPVLEAEYPLEIPGKTLLPGWHVEAEIIDPSAVKGTALTNNDFAVCFDLDEVGKKVTVRCRQPGDRFQPLGMSQPKRLNQFMINAKIPHAWRQRVPIVCSPEHILWAVGWRIDERARVNDATQRILRLKFERC